MKKNIDIDFIKFDSLSSKEAEFVSVLPSDSEDIGDIKVPDEIPILPLKNTVLFPGVIFPITVGRTKTLKLVKDVFAKKGFFGAITQFNEETEDPKKKDLYKIGTIGQILKTLKMPDNTTTVIIQGKKKFSLEKLTKTSPYYTAKITPINDKKLKPKDIEVDAVIASLKETAIKIIKLSPHIPNEATFAIKNIENPIFLINFISSNANISVEDKQLLLEENDIKKRAFLLYEMLLKELQLLEIQQDIHKKVKTDIDRKQREFYLHQQIKTIQDELGDDPVQQDIEELKEKTESMKWSQETAQVFEKELNKLQRLNPMSPDYSVQLNYLQTMIELPWGIYTKDNFNLTRAKKILDKDHFGLEKIKERIIEHLAVLKLKKNLKAPILCLYGAPGVGKTSLGKSVARALNRKYVRMSLGGLHDEAEIRGHRRTYIGAMPGRIIQNVKKAQSANPVFVLDEIDKVGADFRGDPSYALLEVLDPEQNSTFHDNFLDVDFDLSKVLFIATANDVSNISPPLLDRMELININGYLMEEKIEIALKHLIPNQLENHGIDKKKLKFHKKALEQIIQKYTAESGVRGLDKMLAKIMRKIARLIASNKEYPMLVKPKDLKILLGIEKYSKETYEKTDIPGIATGLAWTAIGGEILYIETSLSKGKGNLTLTGNLGDVMKESATLALEYVKSHAKELSIEEKELDKWNVHIHVPEGAIPKDGPSAGITMATSIISAFTKRNVKHYIAMTGEITLRGKVLPVGGIKEKILAAKRAGIKQIVLSEENKKNLEEINKLYIKDFNFHFVKNIKEVINFAFN